MLALGYQLDNCANYGCINNTLLIKSLLKGAIFRGNYDVCIDALEKKLIQPYKLAECFVNMRDINLPVDENFIRRLFCKEASHVIFKYGCFKINNVELIKVLMCKIYSFKNETRNSLYLCLCDSVENNCLDVVKYLIESEDCKEYFKFIYEESIYCRRYIDLLLITTYNFGHFDTERFS